MLGKIYTFLFVFTILASLAYQRFYLNESVVEFNAQVMAEHAVLPTITGHHFNSFTYEDGLLASSFSGNDISYFSDKHFEASGNLVYKQFDSSQKNKTNSMNDDFVLKTTRANGDVISYQPSARSLLTKNTLKSAFLPDIVHFNLGQNIGVTSAVHFDAIKKTLDSEKSIESHGPGGNIKGIGFFYEMIPGDFILKSNVEGMVLPQSLKQSP